MLDADKIRETVEQVVRDCFAASIPGLRQDLVEQVLEQLQPVLAPSGGTPTERLRAAVGGIHEAMAQSDILHALLDGVADFCGRSALFLVRGSAAVGWQGRGFRDNDAIKLVNIDLTQGLAGQAYQQHIWAEGPIEEFAPRFAAGFGAPTDGDCLLAPLLIREKVAALIYADAGMQPGGEIDLSALDILIRTAGVWLELLALRKSSAHSAPAAVAAPSRPPAPASTAVPAVDAGGYAAAPISAPAAAISSVASSGSGADEEEELHRKARRFAKLLVDEIKLYNQAKVAEGKQHRDLYSRLKDDIEKSRATFEKRYAQTSVAGTDYFSQELVRNLADANSGLLGENFPR